MVARPTGTAAAKAEAEYRRRLLDQMTGGPRYYDDHGTEADFAGMRDGWMAPQCAVLSWYLNWLEARGLHASRLEPFLEIGAFTAHLSGWLSTQREMRGTCSDLDDSLVRRSMDAFYPQLGFRRDLITPASADAADLPFEDASFGLVIAFSTVHHFADPDRCLKEIRRVLRPGGVFLCACEPLQPRLRKDRHPVERTEVAEGLHENVYTLARWDELMRGAFEQVESMPYDELRAPLPWAWLSSAIRAPLHRNAMAPLRRAIINGFGGQDYSAACFAGNSRAR